MIRCLQHATGYDGIATLEWSSRAAAEHDAAFPERRESSSNADPID